MRVMVTGGAGFIGSALTRMLIAETEVDVVTVDKLTYASNLASLSVCGDNPRHRFVKADICDNQAMGELFAWASPELVIHLAAETHVDRSIDRPTAFIESNIVGTFALLETARDYWSRLSDRRKKQFRFLHVSTDEVYGSLGAEGRFTEGTPYAPSSPYSASKAAADHLVRAWHLTYGLPTIITNCSNNYGPYQFPEKLIPLMIINGLEGKPLPVYGSGDNIRDWIFVEDHARALWSVGKKGSVGETYNIGGGAEVKNLGVVIRICDLLDAAVPAARPRRELITFVADRPAHDARYAMDTTKIVDELDWHPREGFDSGLAKTVDWYLQNRSWWEPIRSRRYAGERLGQIKSAAMAER